MGKKNILAEQADSIIQSESGKNPLADMADELLAQPQQPSPPPFLSAPSAGGGVGQASTPSTGQGALLGGQLPPSALDGGMLDDAGDGVMTVSPKDQRREQLRQSGVDPDQRIQMSAPEPLTLDQRGGMDALYEPAKEQVRKGLGITPEVFSEREKKGQEEKSYFSEKFADATLEDIDRIKSIKIPFDLRELEVAKAGFDDDIKQLQDAADGLKLMEQDAKAAIQQNPEQEEQILAGYNAEVSRFNQMQSMAQKQQSALQAKAESIERDATMARMREFEIKSKQGSFGGATWNNLLDNVGSAVSGLNTPLLNAMLSMSPAKPREGETQEQADNRVRRTLREGMRGSYRGMAESEGTTDEYAQKMQEGFWGGAWLAATGTAPLAAMGGLGLIANAADATMQEMEGEEFDNIPEWKKAAFSSTIGVIIGLLEKKGLQQSVDGGPMARQILSKVLDKLPKGASSQQLKAALSAETDNALLNMGVRFGGAMAAEGATELQQGFIEPGLKHLFNKAEENNLLDSNADGKKGFDTPATLSEYVSDAVYQSAQGAFGGTIFATPKAVTKFFKEGVLGKTATNVQFEVAEELLKNPEFEATLSEELKAQVESSKISEVQAKETISIWKEAQQVVSKIPSDMKVEKRREAFDLLTEKAKLSKMDKALVGDKIIAIDEKLAALAGVTESTPTPTPKESAPKKETPKGTPDPKPVEVEWSGEEVAAKEATSEDAPAQDNVRTFVDTPTSMTPTQDGEATLPADAADQQVAGVVEEGADNAVDDKVRADVQRKGDATEVRKAEAGDTKRGQQAKSVTKSGSEDFRKTLGHLLVKPNTGRASLMIGDEVESGRAEDAFTYSTRGTVKKTYSVDVISYKSPNGTRYVSADKDGQILSAVYVTNGNEITGAITDIGSENVGIGTNLLRVVMDQNKDAVPSGIASKQGVRLIDRASTPTPAPPAGEAVTQPAKKEKAPKEEKPQEATKPQEAKPISDKAKAIADKLRQGKLGGKGLKSTIPGFDQAWDTAIEAAALTIEASGTAAQAIADAIRAFKATDWYKSATQAERQKREVEVSDYVADITSDKPKAEAKEPETKEEKVEPTTEQEAQEQSNKGPMGPAAAVAMNDERRASSTSTKNAVVEAERAERNADPIYKAAVKTNEETFAEAERMAEANPLLAAEIVTGLNDGSKTTVSEVEEALLLFEKIRLRNERKKMFDIIDNKNTSDSTRNEASERWNELEEKIDAVDRATRKSGTIWGRLGQFRQRMMNEDYSFEAMERKARIAKGEPLTEKESAKIKEQAERIAELERQLADANLRAEEAAAVSAIEQEIGAMKEQVDSEGIPKNISPRVFRIAEKMVSELDLAADAARARIKARTGQLSAGIDPAILYDVSVIGAAKLGHAALDFAKWSDAMIAELGDSVKPYLEQAWKKAEQIWKEKENTAKLVDREEIKKIRKQRAAQGEAKATIEDRLRAQAKEGMKPAQMRGLVQQLALSFVRQGITKRNELIDSVHEVLSDIIEISKEDTRDLISGYGDFKTLDKEPAKVKLRELKGQMQQVAKIEDMMAGMPPKKTGIERRETSPEERRLNKEVNDLKRKGGFVVTDPEAQLKSALDAIKTRLQNEISDLDNAIATKVAIPKGKNTIQVDSEIEGLRKKRDEMRELYNEAFPKKEPTREELIKRAEKSIDRSIKTLEEDIERGAPKKAKSSPYSFPELDAKKKRLEDLRKQRDEIRDLANPKKTPEDIALQAQKTRLKSEIEKFDNAIASNSAIPKSSRSVKSDAELEALVEERAEAKSRYDALFPKLPPTREQLLERAEKSIDRSISNLEDDIKRGAPAKSKSTPYNFDELSAKKERLEDLRKQRDEMRDLANPKKTPEEKALQAHKTRLKSDIDRLEAAMASGSAISKGKTAAQVDAELENLAKERADAKERYDAMFPKPGPTREQLLERAEKSLDRSIKLLEENIKAGATKSNKAKPYSFVELDAKKARLEALREERKEIRELANPKLSPEERALQSFKKRTLNTIAELKERMAKGDFSVKERKPIRLDEAGKKLALELFYVKKQFNHDRFMDSLKNRSMSKKIKDEALHILNTARAIITSFDLSAAGRQGFLLGMAHPQLAAKAFARQLKAIVSKSSYLDYWNQIQNRPNYEMSQRAGLFLVDPNEHSLAKMEEAYMSRYAEMIPGVGASQRAYTTYLNQLRIDSFDAIVNNLGSVTPEQARAIANYINISTGRGNLAGASGASISLNAAFFSPRLVVSRFEYLLGQPLYGGDKATRKAIAKEYARTAIAASVIVGLYLLASDDEDDKDDKDMFDPRSSRFMKMKVGENTYIDIFAGLTQAAVLMYRIASGEKKTMSGKVTPIRGDVPYGADSSWDVFASFLRTKFSPPVAAFWNLATGKNVIGDETTVKGEAFNMTTPMVGRDIYDAIIGEGVSVGVALGILSILGIGVQTHEDKQKVGRGVPTHIPKREIGRYPKPRSVGTTEGSRGRYPTRNDE